MPGDDRLGFDDDQRRSPIGPSIETTTPKRLGRPWSTSAVSWRSAAAHRSGAARPHSLPGERPRERQTENIVERNRHRTLNIGLASQDFGKPNDLRKIGVSENHSLDHVIIFSEAGLYRQMKSFSTYYHWSRTHLSLAKDSPEPRAVQPMELGRIVAIPQVGGLHHRYERRAA